MTDTKTDGGIVIPDTAKEKSAEGEVIAIGPGAKEKGENIPISVKIGDKVLFGKWAGTDIPISGCKEGTYMIIKESELIAIIGGK